MADIEMQALEIEMLKEKISSHDKDIDLVKGITLELREFRKEFVKDDGYVPKIVKKVRENFKKDLILVEARILSKLEEMDNKIIKFPCQNPNEASEELMKAAGCKVVDVGDKLYPGEKETK